MNETQYAKGTTAENLRVFLAFWPQLFVDAEEARQGMVEDGHREFPLAYLRHTWASLHIQEGTPLHVLQELWGIAGDGAKICAPVQ